jgi:plasmid stabilization system protein ParE
LTKQFFWYQAQQSGLERRFFDDYLIVETRIEENPYQFPTVLENVRRANFPHFPYSIFFEIIEDSVLVYAIFNQSRNPEDWEKRV